MDEYYFNKKFLLHYISIYDYLKTTFWISCISSLKLWIWILSPQDNIPNGMYDLILNLA
jgi:hypothetical protein